MARQEYVLSVFVASPSDVDDERNRLEDVIRELNITWARELGIRLELVRWETHAYPSFGEDPQAVINEQIPNDFDLFIGIMWHRFGTPTGRAGSGTIEEFNHAKTRFDQDNSKIQLMLYFKDAPVPVPPTQLDHAQLAKIGEFRSSLGKEGGLYWPFKSIEDFEQLVRLHLTRHVQSWRTKHVIGQQIGPITKISSDRTIEPPDNVTGEDEPGLLDLVEQFEDEFVTLSEIADRIASATVEIGEKMQIRSKETQDLTSGVTNVTTRDAKRVIARAVTDMDQFVHRIEAELPLFSTHLREGINFLIKASAIVIEINANQTDRSHLRRHFDAVRRHFDAVQKFHASMIEVETEVAGFQLAVKSMPRMTSTLNKAKSAVASVLQRLIEELRNGQAMVREAEASFSAIITIE